jgi:tetratricopeptide (TPR) repeat protein
MDLRRDARIVVVVALVAGGVPRMAIAQAPNDSYYNFLMGRHLEGEDNIPGALAALERAAAADPKAAEVRAEIARIYYRRENRDESEKAAKAALAIDDKNFEANRILGLI